MKLEPIDGKIPYVVPTPEQLVGELVAAGECCSCTEKLLLAMALAQGIVPEPPGPNYIEVDKDNNPV